MPRFVIANRRAGKFQQADQIAASAAVGRVLTAMAPAVQIVGDNQADDPTARRVVIVEADPSDIAAAPRIPDVIIEPELPRWPSVVRPADFLATAPETLAAPVSQGAQSLTVAVTGMGLPLPNSQVLLYLRGPGQTQRQLQQVTGWNGQARFFLDPLYTPAAVVVEPPGQFWSMMSRSPSTGAYIDCPRLPAGGPLGWWHAVLGATTFNPAAGTGIRVGVVDTGAGPHPCLAHVRDVGAFLDGGEQPAPAGADVDIHGSHVCGIIGARPLSLGQYAGLAPGADLLVARVFRAGQAANQGDVANAVDALSRTYAADLINLSLSAPTPSEIERDAIRDAMERGTLVVCAAGNSSAAVEYPAAYPECVAVSALGLEGAAPAGTLAASWVPSTADRFGSDRLFLATFSNLGESITCAGPGVAIVSTVPARYGMTAPYAALDGTSMASPAVCGALAAMLSASPWYRGARRDEARRNLALQILRQACRDVGMSRNFQGAGLPDIRYAQRGTPWATSNPNQSAGWPLDSFIRAFGGWSGSWNTGVQMRPTTAGDSSLAGWPVQAALQPVPTAVEEGSSPEAYPGMGSGPVIKEPTGASAPSIQNPFRRSSPAPARRRAGRRTQQ